MQPDNVVDFERARSDANELSGLASNRARELALAGIAIAWVFSGGGGDSVATVDIDDFKSALFLFVLALAADFLQYVWSGVVHRLFLMIYEKQLKSGGRNYPKFFRRVAMGFWTVKLLLTGAGHVLLALAIAARL